MKEGWFEGWGFLGIWSGLGLVVYICTSICRALVDRSVDAMSLIDFCCEVGIGRPVLFFHEVEGGLKRAEVGKKGVGWIS